MAECTKTSSNKSVDFCNGVSILYEIPLPGNGGNQATGGCLKVLVTLDLGKDNQRDQLRETIPTV
ncbi:MAG: hypothetical protein MPJ24_03160 [Pirellulaceae bacterium]|nr:hypothetical protein [Pirellulaceae bacterium]